MRKKKRNRLILILVISLLALLAIEGALAASRLVFAAGGVYWKDAATLDLRNKNLSVSDYLEIQSKLPQTQIVWNVPLQQGGAASNTRILRLSRLTESDLQLMPYFRQLEAVESEGCRDYDRLDALQQMLPDCPVNYDVLVGSDVWSRSAASVQVTSPDVGQLREALAHMPALTEVELLGTLPSNAELAALRQDYPDIRFRYHFTWNGISLTDAEQTLDLRNKTVDISELTELLTLLPELQEVDIRGAELDQQALAALAQANPKCLFLWEVTVGGEKFSTDLRELDLSGLPVTTEEAEALVPLFRDLERVIMCNCGPSNEEMDALNRRHEDIRFIWSVRIQEVELRTDATYFYPIKFRRDFVVTEADMYPIRFCTDLVAIDVGHMFAVKTCTWAETLSNLEYLVIGETGITDISPLSNLKKLKYLELFSVKVTDYTPLLECTALEDLNLGLTYGDPAVVSKMKWLKNLWWCDANGYNDPARREAVKQMCEELPDTKINIYIDHPTAANWRKLPNYFAMRDLMGMFYLD